MVLAYLALQLGVFESFVHSSGGLQEPNETTASQTGETMSAFTLSPSGDIRLPPPSKLGAMSLEEALDTRRSVRSYSKTPLTLQQVSQLLWSAQGITSRDGFRTAPSAGALYPLETYVVAGNVENLSAGIYKYRPRDHALTLVVSGDKRVDVCNAALQQESLQKAPATIAFAAVYHRTSWKYGERGIRYVAMEAGHAAQNVCLQAVSLGLGTVTIGAFHDDRIKKTLRLENDEEPLYLLPVGRN